MTRGRTIPKMEDKLNVVLHHLQKHATAGPDDDWGRWEGSLEDTVGTLLHLKAAPEASKKKYAAVTTYTRPLADLGLVKLVRRPYAGHRGGTSYPSAYLVRMKRSVTARDIIKFREEKAEEQARRQRRERKEERLAGEYPDREAGGSEVRSSRPDDNHGRESDHMNTMTHRHGQKDGPHSHRADGIYWQRVVHFHSEVQTHAHEGKDPAPHKHIPNGDGGRVEWQGPGVEYRHHTHTKESEAGNGTRAEVVEDLAGGHAAMLVKPERDGLHRKLLDELYERDATIRRLEGRLEKAEEERDELRLLLDRATDPTVAEAESYLSERGKS